jgi:site-specific DNA-methyltransferase (adenine-specific)/adenine-specific DNA-methyltransferase
MPELNWIGKAAVVKHHKEVPFRLLETDPKLSCGGPDSGNLIVEGDNLHALKALLPRYAGKVKCIYIDPPYNTGNEGWVYNDNVKAPEIVKWLGETVGKEAEDLTRHDKWLCMMYPRLVLLKQFLAEDGAIFVSIDDNEVASLKLLMDEIFAKKNFIAQLIVQMNARGQTYKAIAKTHEYCLAYARSDSTELSEVADTTRKYPYEDKIGGYELWELRNRNPRFNRSNRPNLFFPIYAEPVPFEGKQHRISLEQSEKYSLEIFPRNSKNEDGCWRWSKSLIISENSKRETPTIVAKINREGKGTVWQRARKNTKSLKSILQGSEYLNEAGTTFISSLDMRGEFDFPKPVGLLQSLLQLSTDGLSLILDSFAGSGTTGHAVLKQNAADGGDRKFILVEMDQQIAKNVTAERVRRVTEGYTDSKGKKVEGHGGGFQYCRLSKDPLFDAYGAIREDVSFAQLAEFVWFVETGAGYTAPKKESPLLGIHNGRAIYLLYNGILKDRSDLGGNVLNQRTLQFLESDCPHEGPKTIYGARSRYQPARLKAAQIEFKQLPYRIQH